MNNQKVIQIMVSHSDPKLHLKSLKPIFGISSGTGMFCMKVLWSKENGPCIASLKKLLFLLLRVSILPNW